MYLHLYTSYTTFILFILIYSVYFSETVQINGHYCKYARISQEASFPL